MKSNKRSGAKQRNPPSPKKHKKMRALSPSAIRAMINRDIPELKITTIKKVNQGFCNDVFEINGEWIVRFPKGNRPVRSVERRVLQALEGKTTLEIPRLCWADRTRRFFIYRKIRGVPMTIQRWTTLGVKAKRRFASDLAIFYGEVHRAISMPRARRLGVKSLSKSWQWNTSEETRLEQVRGGKHFRRVAKKIFEEYCRLKQRRPSTAFLHSDCGWSNVIWDAKEKRVRGVIDFGMAQIGDIHFEFLPWYYLIPDNPDLCATMIRRYRTVNPLPASLAQVKRLLVLTWMKTLAHGAGKSRCYWYRKARSVLRTLLPSQFGEG